MSWSSTRKHGLIRLDKTRRPCFLAFQSVFAQWPAGGRMLTPPAETGPGVYAASILNAEKKEVVVSLVNSTGTSRTETIQISGAQQLEPIKNRLFSGGKLLDEPVPDFVDQAFQVTLAPFSTQTVTCSFDEILPVGR